DGRSKCVLLDRAVIGESSFRRLSDPSYRQNAIPRSSGLLACGRRALIQGHRCCSSGGLATYEVNRTMRLCRRRLQKIVLTWTDGEGPPARTPTAGRRARRPAPSG